MQQGISIYLGLDNTFEENINLIQTASKLGIKRMFTSLHIPETNAEALQKELTSILQTAKSEEMEIISDISPNTLQMLGMKKLSFTLFKSWGIQTLRMDFGYGAKEIAKFTNNEKGIRIQLNASTITTKLLAELARNGANLRNIDALHNFYPRTGTGLSEELFLQKNELLRSWGIRIGAFSASRQRKRSPLHDGLPTLEAHRTLDVSLTARHLAALGTNSVFIGDPLPSGEELAALASATSDVLTLKARLLTKDPTSRKLLNHIFTSRVDEARDAIRANESRTLISGVIPAENTVDRPYGAITLDNKAYLRYMGELQIIRTPHPPDTRVNVIAQIPPEEQILLSCLSPGKKFTFQFI